MRRSETVEAITNELSILGIPYIEERLNSGHVRILWSFNGQRRGYITTRSRTDVRAWKNARSDVRRMLRQDGALA